MPRFELSMLRACVRRGALAAASIMKMDGNAAAVEQNGGRNSMASKWRLNFTLVYLWSCGRTAYDGEKDKVYHHKRVLVYAWTRVIKAADAIERAAGVVGCSLSGRARHDNGAWRASRRQKDIMLAAPWRKSWRRFMVAPGHRFAAAEGALLSRASYRRAYGARNFINELCAPLKQTAGGCHGCNVSTSGVWQDG